MVLNKTDPRMIIIQKWGGGKEWWGGGRGGGVIIHSRLDTVKELEGLDG